MSWKILSIFAFGIALVLGLASIALSEMIEILLCILCSIGFANFGALCVIISSIKNKK